MMFNTIIKIFLDVLLPLLDICTDIQFTIELKMHKDPLFIGSGNIYHMIVFTWSVGIAALEYKTEILILLEKIFNLKNIALILHHGLIIYIKINLKTIAVNLSSR